jgi:hypothetical protein
VYLDMPPNYTIDDAGAESTVMETSGNEKDMSD